MPHRYAHVGIEALSPAQARKLVRGERTKVKLGNHHKIHVTHEHAKRLHAAHRRGAGIMLELDPYAQDLNAHIAGEGLFSKVKNMAKKAAQFAPVQDFAHQAIEKAGAYASQHGIDPRLIEQASSMAHGQFAPPHGGSLKSFRQGIQKFAKNPIVNKLGHMAFDEAKSLAGMGFMGMGAPHRRAPVRKARRPVKRGMALYPAGMGFEEDY